MSEVTGLRAPAHRASRKAPSYWRLVSAWTLLPTVAAPIVGWFAWRDRPWWAALIGLALAAVGVGYVIIMPAVRYGVHAWEVTDAAVYTRSGWLVREERIAPLSRVQTVDTTQNVVMRLFGLRSITVTTASAAGPITIACLDAAVADRTVAELTAITGRSAGDAT